MCSRVFLALGMSVLTLAGAPRLDAKEQSRFVTAPMRAAALANAKKLPWAREQQERAVSAAKPWVERSDDELWAMVPAQELPRTIYTNEGVIYKGQSPACPNCGDAAPAKYGRSWWSPSLDKPWKIRCKQCGEVYPKNDFGAFYKTALDEHGMFRRKLGDRSLLFHADHPHPDDPLHALYVDDGYGMFDPQGKRHDAIAYYCQHNLLQDYPKLKQSFFVQSRLNVLDAMMPNTGDSGSVGAWGRQGSAATYMLAYKLYRDPRFANLAHREHDVHKSSLRLSDDVYQPDPDALTCEVRKIARAEPSKLPCEHFGRYGQACLQTENAQNGRAVFICYGQGRGHSHHDTLNLGLLAKNVAMIPDLGYPEYTGSWPKRHAWTANTVSHNTLLVGDARSVYSPGGKIQLFSVQPPLRVIQVDAPGAYKGLKTYCRTVAMVDVGDDDSYVVDVFRARGGTNHRLSWHGAAETAQVADLELVDQKTGTFAGPDVPLGTLDGPHAAVYQQSGFTYLYDVQRSAGRVDTPYTVDWTIEDIRGRIRKGKEPHLRLHGLTACDEVALATGDSPRKLQRPRYLLQSRLGKNVESQFVNVLEPYDRARLIKRARRLQVEHETDENSVAAVAVELVDGTTDVLISCREPTAVKVEGDIELDGTFGMIRLADGISTGDVTVVRGFKNPADFTAGYTYLVNPGDRYVVPTRVGSDEPAAR
ncbi:heparinase II/III family protein [Planctomycetota bacterium]